MPRTDALPADQALPYPTWLREVGLGFAYWLAFLLLLEPGNVMHAAEVGQPLDWSAEALRMTAAAALGASVTPLLLAVVRRFPVDENRFWPTAAIHAGVSAAVAAVLIVASCFLAAGLIAGETRPLLTAIRQELAANWALLVYCIAAFVAAAHALRFMRKGQAPATPAWKTQVVVTCRGSRIVVPLEAVAWIETQGNYLALHTDGVTHLIRETARRFEASIDPARFVRIHRRVIVAVGQVRSIELLDGGDAMAVLADGAELRVSRGYRRALVERLAS